MADAHIVHYRSAFQFSQNFLKDMRVSSFPLDVFSLEERIEEYYGLTVLMSKLADYNTHRASRGKKPVHIKDGRCIYDPKIKTYLIIYNENCSMYRIRFTIAHEFAHIVLGHLGDEETELDRGGLADLKYFRYEGEANTFAGNSLVPPILINEGLAGQKYDIEYVQAFFAVSKHCAQYRERDYEAWLQLGPGNAEKEILKKCSWQMHIRHCLKCDTQFLNKDARYCTVCGRYQLSKIRSKTYMKYSSILLDKNSKAHICPRCENERINNGEYCKVCGVHIVNRCTNESCELLADGDARYCYSCGTETTFNLDKLLRDWKQEFPQELIFNDDDNDGLPF